MVGRWPVPYKYTVSWRSASRGESAANRGIGAPRRCRTPTPVRCRRVRAAPADFASSCMPAIAFDRFYRYAELTALLHAFAREHPDARRARIDRQEPRGPRHLGADGHQRARPAPPPRSPRSGSTATSTRPKSPRRRRTCISCTRSSRNTARMPTSRARSTRARSTSARASIPTAPNGRSPTSRSGCARARGRIRSTRRRSRA